MKKQKPKWKTKTKKKGKLKNNKASLKLKENVAPFYYEARKLPLHLLPNYWN